jgi:hypothetical protein
MRFAFPGFYLQGSAASAGSHDTPGTLVQVGEGSEAALNQVRSCASKPRTFLPMHQWRQENAAMGREISANPGGG